MIVRAFSNDPEVEGSGNDPPQSPAGDAEGGDYQFDGFKVVLVEKVMLTPVVAVVAPAPSGALSLMSPRSRRLH